MSFVITLEDTRKSYNWLSTFSGEEILLVSLARIATGDPWIQLIKGYFGGEPRRWCYAFKWFVNHLFTLFFNKILGHSIEMWLPEMQHFKQLVVERLRKPAHSRELEFYNDLGERNSAEHYVIDVESVDDWCVFGFIDDTGVQTCRLGSGPDGLNEGPGRPWRQHAYLIQRVFFWYALLIFWFLFWLIIYFHQTFCFLFAVAI